MRSTESGFNAIVYLAAAEENLTACRELLDANRFVLASYVARVAVESLLLAYQTRLGAEHDAGHNLPHLAYNGRFWEGMPSKQKQSLTEALGEFVLRWRNNHRYRSEQAFRDWLTRNKLFIISGSITTKEDIAVFNTEILVEAAQRIVQVGVARWSQTQTS